MMTLHDFVQWCHDNELDIASTTIDHGTARIELSSGLADNAEGRLPLDGKGDLLGAGAWFCAMLFVDVFGGWARWYGADVVMRIDDGPTIAIRTESAPMSDGLPRRRYPDAKVLPWFDNTHWPPADDEQPALNTLMETSAADDRPDFMSLTDYHGDA
jgi:hypothetical protein